MIEESPYVKVAEEWWNSFPRRSRSRGNIAGGLVIIENMRSNFSLEIESHKAERSDQLRGASAPRVQEILSRFGEDRVLLKEGGRTNRGLMKNLAPLLGMLSDAGISELTESERDSEFTKIQAFLAEKARDIFNADKISFDYSPGITSRAVVGAILDSGRNRGKGGEIAEYLVGAKLALRFPDYDIRNSAMSAADDQTAEKGDFQMNDCVFHVTVSPNIGHYEKCQRNLDDGLRVFLLVPDRALIGARQNADSHVSGEISVESIESFVSQNIEELSDFSSGKVSENLRGLLEIYNERVGEVETDLSLQIRIPSVLSR